LVSEGAHQFDDAWRESTRLPARKHQGALGAIVAQ
jgi:hypothetical protein